MHFPLHHALIADESYLWVLQTGTHLTHMHGFLQGEHQISTFLHAHKRRHADTGATWHCPRRQPEGSLKLCSVDRVEMLSLYTSKKACCLQNIRLPPSSLINKLIKFILGKPWVSPLGNTNRSQILDYVNPLSFKRVF